MVYKLIRLASDIEDKNRKEFTDQFIDEINLSLNEENIFLDETIEDAKYNIVLIESGGSEEKFIEIFPTLKDPIIIINTNKYNSLAATFEINTYCHEHGKDPYIFYGDTHELSTIFKRFSEVLSVKEELFDLNLGVIGKPSNWLIASQVDYSLVKEKIGINLIDIDYEEFINEINKKEYKKPKQYSLLLEKIGDRKDDLEQALYIYGALKRLTTKYKLKGLTVRCFDLLKTHKSTACLALSLLNSEGIICACEGDVPSLITMVLVERLTGFSSFQANPSFINTDKDELMLSHCTLPLNMTSNYELDTHFESGLGIGIKGELEKGYVTIIKISKDFKKCLCVEGQIIENLSLEGYCRTQILTKFERHDMIALATSKVGNHLIVAYGKKYHRFMGLITNLFPDIEY